MTAEDPTREWRPDRRPGARVERQETRSVPGPPVGGPGTDGRRCGVRRGTLTLLTLLASAAVGACGGSPSSSPAAYGAPSAEQAVRTFLEALNRQDYPLMARHFGTREGPAERKWGTEEVEQRMLVLSGLLEHRGYSLRRARLTESGAHRRRFMVTLEGTRYGTVTLPVVSVRSGSGRWFVERIDTSPLRP